MVFFLLGEKSEGCIIFLLLYKILFGCNDVFIIFLCFVYDDIIFIMDNRIIYIFFIFNYLLEI